MLQIENVMYSVHVTLTNNSMNGSDDMPCLHISIDSASHILQIQRWNFMQKCKFIFIGLGLFAFSFI